MSWEKKYLKYKTKYFILKKQMGGDIEKINIEYKGVTLNVDVPSSFISSITLQLFKDPVITVDGHTYERESIEEWFINHNTSPNTNIVLSNKTLIPNLILKNAIEEILEDAYKKHMAAAGPAGPAGPAAAGPAAGPAANSNVIIINYLKIITELIHTIITKDIIIKNIKFDDKFNNYANEIYINDFKLVPNHLYYIQTVLINKLQLPRDKFDTFFDLRVQFLQESKGLLISINKKQQQNP